MKLCQAWLHVPAAVSKNQADLFQGLNDIRCTVPQGLNDNRCIFLADTRNQLVASIPPRQTPARQVGWGGQRHPDSSRRACPWAIAIRWLRSLTQSQEFEEEGAMAPCVNRGLALEQEFDDVQVSLAWRQVLAIFFESKLSWVHRRMYVRISQNKSL